MIHRYTFQQSQLDPLVRVIKRHFSRSERQVLEAFNSAASTELKALTWSDFERNIKLACQLNRTKPPFVLLNTISALVLRSQAAVAEALIKEVDLLTETPHEVLRVNLSGNWQVAWLKVSEGEEIYSLDWHFPDAQESTPITPQPLIDYISGCITLYRAGLILPALAVLSMAYESALWGALEMAGTPRSVERITYESLDWKIKKVGKKYVIDVINPDSDSGGIENGIDGYIDTAKAKINQISTVAGLRSDLILNIASDRLSFLATTRIASKEVSSSRGLRNAIELARSKALPAIAVVPKPLDETFVAIRNNLVHIPADGKFDEPIPVHGQHNIADIASLTGDNNVFLCLLGFVMSVIQQAYRGPTSTS